MTDFNDFNDFSFVLIELDEDKFNFIPPPPPEFVNTNMHVSKPIFLPLLFSEDPASPYSEYFFIPDPEAPVVTSGGVSENPWYDSWEFHVS